MTRPCRRCPTASPISITTPGATSASSPTSRLLGQQLNANFRLELFHLGHLYKRPVVVNVLRDGIPAPIPYTAESLRLRAQQVRRQPADQPRLRRLPPEVSDQRAARLGRGRGVPRRELFPLPRPRPALRPLGARARDRRRPAAQRGVPLLPRVLDRDAGPERGDDRHLRAARRRVGDRRLPLRCSCPARKPISRRT